MPRLYLFSDESGDLTRRTPQPGVTRYFAVGTLLVDEMGLGEIRRALARTRDHLAWNSHGLDSYFHASADSVHVRSVVFEALASLPFEVDVTLVEKLRAPLFSQESERTLAFWPCASDFALQAADYCLWAVCRYWERGDDSFRKLIESKIRSEMCLRYDSPGPE